MSAPAFSPTRTRTNWLLTAVEVGFVLAAAGVVFLHLNPLWHLNESGFLDPYVHSWNLVAETLIAIGLLMATLALLLLPAALVSRCFRDRPSWPYLVATVVICGLLAWLAVGSFTRDFDARFEWSSCDGFSVFHLEGPAAVPSLPSANWLWTFLIGIQVQPQLEGYFHVIDWQRVNGHIGVAVVRIIPIAWPIGLGKEGESLEDPDETPLMQAADKGEFDAIQRLLAAKPDVNARDQSGQTALIYACRNPKADPAAIKALLAAGADPNFRSHNDYSALTWATAHNDKAVIQLLRRAGARP
jgi:Ankyrin repeats (3 copies)